MKFHPSTKPLYIFWGFLTVFLWGCNHPKAAYMFISGNAQGTTYSIKYQSTDFVDFSTQIDSIFRVIDNSMSTYQPQSIISRINAGEDSVKLDEHFKKVFEQSYKVYQETKGAFDPTIGTLAAAYGFGRAEEQLLLDPK